ncbi:MAG: hypothetical protein WBD80_05225 [Xanthobacteraceae bacterium]
MKKLVIALALCGSLIGTPVQAKTFVGVLWPMFGPLPAIGLVELVAELKSMPDVEVQTYVHQAWPSLVDDLAKLPPGTHTVVVGYSLGANSSVFVANDAKHVDLIVALQPSMLSWNPPLKPGKVGRMIEIYNPNPWETFGGMGSKKLEGDNIEYIANNDSHPGAQFNSQFRNLVKTEVAKFADGDRLETAQADAPKPLAYAQSSQSMPLEPVLGLQGQERGASAAGDRPQIAQAELPKIPAPAARVPEQRPKQQLARSAEPVRPEPAVDERAPAHGNPANDRPQVAQAELPKLPAPENPAAQPQPSDVPAFVDTLSSAVNSGDLFAQRQLTAAGLKDYAERRYRGSPTAGWTRTASN